MIRLPSRDFACGVRFIASGRFLARSLIRFESRRLGSLPNARLLHRAAAVAPMQALAEARVPDAAKPREYPERSALVWWLAAVQYIVERGGYSQKDAFCKLSDLISLGVVQAVNGYNEPLSPRLFPDRLVQDFCRCANAEISDPPSYAEQRQSPDHETYIRLDTLQKFCLAQPGINSSIAQSQLETPEGKLLTKTRVTPVIAENFAKQYVAQAKAEGRRPTMKGGEEAAQRADLKGSRDLLREALAKEIGPSAKERGRPKNNSRI